MLLTRLVSVGLICTAVVAVENKLIRGSASPAEVDQCISKLKSDCKGTCQWNFLGDCCYGKGHTNCFHSLAYATSAPTISQKKVGIEAPLIQPHPIISQEPISTDMKLPDFQRSSIPVTMTPAGERHAHTFPGGLLSSQ